MRERMDGEADQLEQEADCGGNVNVCLIKISVKREVGMSLMCTNIWMEVLMVFSSLPPMSLPLAKSILSSVTYAYFLSSSIVALSLSLFTIITSLSCLLSYCYLFPSSSFPQSTLPFSPPTFRSLLYC